MMREEVKAIADVIEKIDEADGFILILVKKVDENQFGMQQHGYLPKDDEECRAIMRYAAEYLAEAAENLKKNNIQ